MKRFDRAHPKLRGYGLRSRARSNIGYDDRHDDEEGERSDIRWLSDGERVDRRQEKKIIAERSSDTGQQRWPQPQTHSDADDSGQKNKIDIFDAEPGLDSFPKAERQGYSHQCQRVGPRLEHVSLLGRADRFLRDRIARDLITRDDVNADIAGTAHEVVHDGTVQDFEPARAGRLSNDNLCHVVGVRVGDHVVGDAPVATR